MLRIENLLSPKRQYRGMRSPTTPVTHAPEWMPMRTRIGMPGKWAILNLPHLWSSSRAIVAISPACLMPLRCGKPETTMYLLIFLQKKTRVFQRKRTELDETYASPIVSTLYTSKQSRTESNMVYKLLSNWTTSMGDEYALIVVNPQMSLK